MKFIWIDKEKSIDQIPFLKNNIEPTEESFDQEVTVYKVKKITDDLHIQMNVLEKCGLLALVKETDEIETAKDIIPMTKKVEKLKSSPMYLKIFFPNTTFLLSESELMCSTAFRKFLLREGKFINIGNKDWVSIVQAWLGMAIEITEETEEDQLVDKVLNYLSNCTIYTEKSKAISKNTLYYNEMEEPEVVYCFIDALMDIINNKRKTEITSRKLRAMLSTFVDGNSVQERIYNTKYRFWRFYINKTGIDIERQKYVDDENDSEDNKDSGETRNGQDHLFSE